MAAGLGDPLFWGALAAALAVAFVLTVPVNKWMIGRGKGHAVVHEMHGHDAHATSGRVPDRNAPAHSRTQTRHRADPAMMRKHGC